MVEDKQKKREAEPTETGEEVEMESETGEEAGTGIDLSTIDDLGEEPEVFVVRAAVLAAAAGGSKGFGGDTDPAWVEAVAVVLVVVS